MSRLASKIVVESFKIVIFTSILSSIGGLGLQSVEDKIYTIIPLLILLPALNNVVGDFGTITSSKFTSLLYMGKIRGKLRNSKALRDMFGVVAPVVMISAVVIATLSCIVSYFWGYPMDLATIVKVFTIAILAVACLFTIIAVVVIAGGLYIFKHKQDPDNFLIPITTSIADLGNMAIFALLVGVLF
jgi:cation transporter-like permease